MSKNFKDFWTKKSHDVPIQAELDEVKEDVHELDEAVDQYEDADGNLKPGVSVDKNTVHITYDRKGVPVNSYVDDIDTEKARMEVMDCPKCFGRGWRMVNGEKEKCYECGGCGAVEKSSAAQVGKFECKRCGYIANIKLGNCPKCSSSDGWITKKEVSKMDIGDAGGTPNSLLARQDLEGKEKSEESDVDDPSLYELKDTARDADTKAEKKEVTDKIKEVQVKRQKATLKERGVAKSFKSVWSILTKAVISPEEAEQNWVRLKRERKELENLIATLSTKAEKIEEDGESVEDKLSDAQDKLDEVNRDIDDNLDYLRTNG